MLGVAAVAVLLITIASGLFDYLGDRIHERRGGADELRASARTCSATSSGCRRGITIAGHRRADQPGDHRHRAHRGQPDGPVLHAAAWRARAGRHRGVLVSVDWRLGLITLCAAPLVFLTAVRYARLTRVNSRQRRAAVGELTGFVTESLQGIRTVHAFGSQELEDRRFGSTNSRRAEHRAARSGSERPVHSVAGVGGRDRHRRAVVRRRVRRAAQLVVGRVCWWWSPATCRTSSSR